MVFNPQFMRLDFAPDENPERPWRTALEHSYFDGLVHVDVPEQYYTDLASVPWWLHWLYPTGGRHQRAALFHDFLYETKRTKRFAADAVFRTILENDGVAPWRCRTMYFAVRLFGGRAWNAK